MRIIDYCSSINFMANKGRHAELKSITKQRNADYPEETKSGATRNNKFFPTYFFKHKYLNTFIDFILFVADFT
jgi:hypothetical protein